jgi:mono/diheme cytochrome c family protein
LLIAAVFLSSVVGLSAADGSQDLIKLGEYLVVSHGCADCHSPKKGTEPDMSRYLSGHPVEDKIPEIPKGVIGEDKWGGIVSNDGTVWVDAFGITFTRNLTPDVDTGLGSWTEDMFIRAIRTGKHMGAPEGRDINPCMPWPAFSKINDQEMKAIWAYLRSLKPIRNPVPDPIPASVAFSEKKQ